MFFEWLGREGAGILSWWLLTSLAGVAVFPLFFRLMGGVPSRGYPLARTAGLMLVTFVFWLLNILQLLRNDAGSVMLAWFIVFCVGLVSYATWPERASVWQWFKQNRGLILTTELLFAGLFLGWATVRALNPNLGGTEKPMEMAFLSAIRRSATFPPNDPWMSGYAISYYHFGYIIAATLAKLSDVTNGIAFNLMASLAFSLAGTGIFGVVFDLVASRLVENVMTRRRNDGKEKHKTDEEAEVEYEIVATKPSRLPAIAAGLIGTFFLVLMGNFGTTLVEVPYQAGLIPQGSPYLQWFDQRFRDADFSDCPPSGSLDPTTWCRPNWWWWAYSRVVQDVNPDGGKNEIITEMPIFSFVLSDIHPHVLSLPFTLLVIGLGFNMVMLKRRPERWEMLLYGVWIGGMIFLNSWDAVYLALFVGADALRRLVRNGTGWFTNDDWRGIIGFALALLGLTAVLYSPFFISFRSQAAGILPNVIWPTRFPQFLIMFTPFLVIIAGFLWVEVRRGGGTVNWPLARQLVLYGVGVIVLFFIGFAVIAWLRPEIAYIVYRKTDSIGEVLLDVLRRRIFDGLLTQATLVIILFVVIARLFAREPRNPETDEPTRIITYSPATGYALLLVAAGAVLVLVPEFVYLRDGFGTRINMIFKLWYQAWTLWSVGCAFAVWAILSQIDLRPVFTPSFRQAFAVVIVFLLVAGAVFPAAAITTRAFRDGGHLNSDDVPLTLDGGPTIASTGDDDYQVIQCLAAAARDPNDVVAEATRAGLAYAGQFGRVSALTGIPTLLGWDNHERQWRGDTFDDALNTLLPTGGYESRYDAIATLYNTTDWNAAMTIINRYHITYVFVGTTERNERKTDQSDWLFSRDGIAKFDSLPAVCKSGDVAVYSVDSIRAQITQQQTGG